MSDSIGDEPAPRAGTATKTPAPPASSTSWLEVVALGYNRHRVRLGGFFGPAWMANLCQSIAEHRISIERAHAVRARNGAWVAELNVIALDGATEPKFLPYLALAESTRVDEAGPLALERYELVQTADHGGTLKLTLEAEDALGLLGALLARMAGLGLFPIEMHIDTRDGHAHDCFWLGVVGGTQPSIELLHAADRQLDKLLNG